MVRLAALLLLASLTPATAQDVMAMFRGEYGSATDPATSCAANPHRLDFMAQPPHALFNWATSWTDETGRTVSDQRYDLLSTEGNTLILRLEGDTRRTADGARPIWILRQTTQPQGYCWGRTDWPAVHCENQQLRCDNPTS